MSITTGDILRVVATMLWTDGNVMQNVFNAVVTGGGGPWDDDDITADAVTWLETMFDNIVTQISQDVDGSQAQVYVYDSIDDDWDEVASDNWTWDPSGPAGGCARGVAGLINMKTTDPDVSGKKYIGGVKQGALVDTKWTAAFIADLILFGADWAGSFVGSDSAATWTPGVWSPTETNFHQAGLTLVIPTLPAYQRRRKRGIGI